MTIDIFNICQLISGLLTYNLIQMEKLCKTFTELGKAGTAERLGLNGVIINTIKHDLDKSITIWQAVGPGFNLCIWRNRDDCVAITSA